MTGRNMTTPVVIPQSKEWTTARLVEPSTSGFLHIGASSGPWRFPIALPADRRKAILAQMGAVAVALRNDPRVVDANVFAGILRPPGGSHIADRNTSRADYDAVLLVETKTTADATALMASIPVSSLLANLQNRSSRIMSFVGSNPRRIAPVDHKRQGVFLFNYFTADDVDSNLGAWQYTAGWFQEETGLDNSTVLQPIDADTAIYTVVNHCRWDRLRDVLPALILKRSFHSFVLKVFADNRVVPDPILYRLARQPADKPQAGPSR